MLINVDTDSSTPEALEELAHQLLDFAEEHRRRLGTFKCDDLRCMYEGTVHGGPCEQLNVPDVALDLLAEGGTP